LDAFCTCFYDGCPCKHIVAVLLKFIKNKRQYLDDCQKQQENLKELEGKLKSLSKADLIEFIISSAKKILI